MAPLQPQRAAGRACGGMWGWVVFLPSFLLWPSKAARTWVSAFPCQHQVGEFLPRGLFLTCAFVLLAWAPVRTSLSVVCSDLGNRRHIQKPQTARWTKASARRVLQAQAHVCESHHTEHHMCLIAQVNLGLMQDLAGVSNPGAGVPIPMHVSMWDARKQHHPERGIFPHGVCLFTLA